MNPAQELWRRQANADWDAFEILRRNGAATCHQLHYLQMASEKIAKAYLLKASGLKRSHAGLGKLLRFVAQTADGATRHKIATVFGFKRVDDFDRWVRIARPLADELERLAPALANDGPNPEYPWPHDSPMEAPVSYVFPVWNRLIASEGRRLIHFVEIAVRRFAEYVDL